MLIAIPKYSTPRNWMRCVNCWSRPDRHGWRAYHGRYQGAGVKFNQQIDERSQVAQQCQEIS